ncbi:hypothetical protein VTN77DRAFT_6238 [Rasamsonia byssochlamydoides]|uniref:uncharacterized protein n=1 Tax=Rasamsonia byssochlamydoides TaxID=89139 RepID=UPI003743996C
MTSCFSGGWLVCPDLKNSGKPLLNSTGIAGAGLKEETRSWPLSRSIGRASGSMVASAILQSLISIESALEEQEVQDHPTYIQLAYSIFDTLTRIDSFGEHQQIHFSAQDDEWETAYRCRLGLPLISYKDRWEALRVIPPPGVRSPDSGSPSPGAIWKTGTLRKRRQLKDLARGYLASNPGLDELAPNLALHQKLRAIRDGTKEFDAEGIDWLYNCVTNRLGAMHEADDVRERMGLKFPSIFEFNVECWYQNERQQAKAEEAAKQAARQELRSQVLGLLRTQSVLDEPIAGAGFSYSKPWHYLAIALVESGLDWEKIQEKVAIAAAERVTRSRSIFHVWRGQRVVEDEDVVSHRKAFLQAMKDLGRRVHEVWK